MAEHDTNVRDVARLEVAGVGRVEETGDRLMPFLLLDGHGVEVAAVTEFLHHMPADDASPASLRSCAHELLSRHRFLHLAGRVEGPRSYRSAPAPAPTPPLHA
jgi:hypothetical protein